jgi:hypothetical protein
MAHSFDGDIPIDDIQYIHKLSFIFMDTLDLDIKHGVLIDIHTADPLDPLHEFALVGLLDSDPGGLELGVLCVLL